MTTDEHMRIQRFQALVNAAIKYTGVNLKAVAKPRMLGDVVQIEAELAFVLVKDWQPPQPETKDYPEGDASIGNQD